MQPGSGKEVTDPMIKQLIGAVLAVSFIALLAAAPDAEAKRRCPRGQDDNGTNVCTPK